MKKILSLLMAGAMTAAVFAGCGSTESTSSGAGSSATESAVSADSDWSYIADKGSMVIGITYFEPMNYMDENGKLTGFETEFATAVCEELGVTPDFQEIEWESKELELNSKSIDCIWNGLTITDERKENMSLSTPYMENKQVMVVKAENVEKFSTAEGVAGATVVAEAGSAGEEVAAGTDSAPADEFFADTTFIPVDSQAKALLEVKSGTADIAVIDYVMSIGTLRDGSDYGDLSVVDSQSFAPEQYGIAFRKGSTETVTKVNEAIKKLADDGKLAEIADKYNLKDLIIVK